MLTMSSISFTFVTSSSSSAINSCGCHVSLHLSGTNRNLLLELTAALLISCSLPSPSTSDAGLVPGLVAAELGRVVAGVVGTVPPSLVSNVRAGVPCEGVDDEEARAKEPRNAMKTLSMYNVDGGRCLRGGLLGPWRPTRPVGLVMSQKYPPTRLDRP